VNLAQADPRRTLNDGRWETTDHHVKWAVSYRRSHESDHSGGGGCRRLHEEVDRALEARQGTSYEGAAFELGKGTCTDAHDLRAEQSRLRVDTRSPDGAGWHKRQRQRVVDSISLLAVGGTCSRCDAVFPHLTLAFLLGKEGYIT
jgi:hypothetical protein